MQTIPRTGAVGQELSRKRVRWPEKVRITQLNWEAAIHWGKKVLAVLENRRHQKRKGRKPLDPEAIEQMKKEAARELAARLNIYERSAERALDEIMLKGPEALKFVREVSQHEVRFFDALDLLRKVEAISDVRKKQEELARMGFMGEKLVCAYHLPPDCKDPSHMPPGRKSCKVPHFHDPGLAKVREWGIDLIILGYPAAVAKKYKTSQKVITETLQSPQLYGKTESKGQTYPGKHDPAFTSLEEKLIKQILRRPLLRGKLGGKTRLGSFFVWSAGRRRPYTTKKPIITRVLDLRIAGRTRKEISKIVSAEFSIKLGEHLAYQIYTERKFRVFDPKRWDKAQKAEVPGWRRVQGEMKRLEVLQCLPENPEEALRTVSAAKALKTSLQHASKWLNLLAEEGLVKKTPGLHGGFHLTKAGQHSLEMAHEQNAKALSRVAPKIEA